MPKRHRPEPSLPTDIHALQKLVAKLQMQLRAAGLDPEVDLLTLDEVKRNLASAMNKLMQGDSSAQPEFDKWERILASHPDHIEELKRAEAKWEEEQRPANKAALSRLRQLFPSNMSTITRSRLNDVLGSALARRIIRKPVLLMLTMEPNYIAKIHAADLLYKYVFTGLDLRELRAVYFALPKNGFENDSDGRKTDWRERLRSKLKSLVAKEAAGLLQSDMLINVAYPDSEAKVMKKSRKSKKKTKLRIKLASETGSSSDSCVSRSATVAVAHRPFASKNIRNLGAALKVLKNPKSNANDQDRLSAGHKVRPNIRAPALGVSTLNADTCDDAETCEPDVCILLGDVGEPENSTGNKRSKRNSSRVRELASYFMKAKSALLSAKTSNKNKKSDKSKKSGKNKKSKARGADTRISTHRVPKHVMPSFISELEKGLTLRHEMNVKRGQGKTHIHRKCSLQIGAKSLLCTAFCFLVFVISYTILGIGLFYSAPCGQSPLYELVKRGDVRGVSTLLSKGVNPDAPGTLIGAAPSVGWLLKSETPLLRASADGNLRVVQALLQAGAATDIGGTIGPFGSVMSYSPLHLASLRGHTEVAYALIKAGASLEAMSRTGPFGFVMQRTPLYEAARKGRTSVVDILLKAGHSVDAGRTTGPYSIVMSTTPLHVASQNGHASVVDLLLKAGAKVKAVGTIGPFGSVATSSPLHRASHRGHEKVVSLLLKAGHPVDEGSTSGPFGAFSKLSPLHAAADGRHARVVSLLLKAGAKDLSEL